MTAAVHIDTREFDRAVGLYAAATRKTFAESMNRQMMNAAVKAIGLAERASKQDIQRLNDGNDWKLANWLLSRSPSATQTRISYRTTKSGRVTVRRTDGAAKSASRQKIAARMLRSLVNRRKAAVNFVRVFFSIMAGRFAASVGKREPSTFGKKVAKFRQRIVLATDRNPIADAHIAVDLRGQTSPPGVAPNASGANRRLLDAMSAGMRAATRDMIDYTTRKMSEHGRKYGAR